MRTGRTLLNLCSLLDQDGGRRSLHHEGEALVGVSRDHDRDRKTRFNALCFCVEGLAEFHNVQAALTQSRTDRWRGISLTGRNLKLNKAYNFLCHLFSLRVDASAMKLPEVKSP